MEICFENGSYKALGHNCVHLQALILTIWPLGTAGVNFLHIMEQNHLGHLNTVLI